MEDSGRDDAGWPRGIAPRGSHRSVRDTLASYGSCYPNLIATNCTNGANCCWQQVVVRSFSHSSQANWLMLPLGLDNAVPSLQSHYSSFFTTTNCSAPDMVIGIQTHGYNHLILSLSIPSQVPTFRIKACDELVPSIHRLP